MENIILKEHMVAPPPLGEKEKSAAAAAAAAAAAEAPKSGSIVLGRGGEGGEPKLNRSMSIR